MKFHIVPFLVILHFFIGYSQTIKFPPPHDKISDLSLLHFLNEFKSAIEAKDKTKLLNLIPEKFEFEFDGDNTKEAFLKSQYWEGAHPMIWTVLGKLISYPGDFPVLKEGSKIKDKNQYIIPWITNFTFEEDLEQFNTHFIMGQNVNIRLKPSLQSPIVGKLNYDIVHIEKDQNDLEITHGKSEHGDAEWYQISTTDNKIKGWVFHQFIHNVYGYRLYLERKNNTWWFTSLIVGD